MTRHLTNAILAIVLLTAGMLAVDQISKQIAWQNFIESVQ